MSELSETKQEVEPLQAELLTVTNEPEVVNNLPAQSNLSIFNKEDYLFLKEMAMTIAKCALPKDYSGHGPNCLLALHIATRLNCDPLQVMQNSYIVKGRLGFEAKFVVGLIHSSPLTEGRVDYVLKGKGDSRSCVSKIKLKATGKYVSGPPSSMSQAKAMGWYGRNDNWKHNSDLMLSYRAATYLCRLHFPDLLMGFQTTDELQDVEKQKSNGASELNNLLGTKEGSA